MGEVGAPHSTLGENIAALVGSRKREKGKKNARLTRAGRTSHPLGKSKRLGERGLEK